MSFTKKRRAWAAWGAVVCVVAAVACGSSTPTATPQAAGDGGVVASQTIGAAGGTISSSDGALTVAIPAGALGGDLNITVEEVAAPASGSIGKTYEIGPTGTQFKTPVTLALKYETAELGTTAASDLEVATIVDGAWAPLAGGGVDTAAQTASGTTLHLSPYSLIAASHGSHEDAGNAADTGSDAPSADGGSDAASDDGGDAGIFDAAVDAGDAADGASACSPESVMIGSCLNHPTFCTTYPGTHAGTCTTNDGGQGYVVMCCPADGG